MSRVIAYMQKQIENLKLEIQFLEQHQTDFPESQQAIDSRKQEIQEFRESIKVLETV